MPRSVRRIEKVMTLIAAALMEQMSTSDISRARRFRPVEEPGLEWSWAGRYGGDRIVQRTLV
jgi:hypothetical protein